MVKTAKMSTTFGLLSLDSIIFSIFLITVSTRFATADLTLNDQLPHHWLTKQQSDNRRETTCVIPTETADETYILFDFNDNPIENTQPRQTVSTRTSIKLLCAPGYLFYDGTNLSRSICTPNGKWLPAIKPCLRICDPSRGRNVELSCQFDGRQVDCSKTLLSGTIVTQQCKKFFHPSRYDNEDTTIRCQVDGHWNISFFKCAPNCGKQAPVPLVGVRIVAASFGIEAVLGESPWHVAIFSLPRKEGEPLICSGTLITLKAVLSAAHCFYDLSKNVAKKDPADYEIAVAKLTRNRTAIDSKWQKTFQISEIIFYDRPYNPAVSSNVADVALIILKESVTLSEVVLPACFNDREKVLGFNPGAGARGLLAGWGVDENRKPSKVLKSIRIPFVNYTECVKKITVVTLDKFCAGTDKGSRPLKGDSGGGLLFKEPNTNLFYLRGIVSSTEKFNGSSVTTFTDLSYYLDWIDRVLTEKEDTGKPSSPDERGSRTLSSNLAVMTTKNNCQSTLTYRGCYDVSPKSSLLNKRTSKNHATPEACVDFCATRGNSFAGVANQECLCGQHVPSDLLKRSDNECDYQCQGSCHQKLTCGGKSKVSIYETGVKMDQQIISRFYLGCFKDDNPNARVLNGIWNAFYNEDSPNKCHQHCFNTGFRYFALTFVMSFKP